MEDVTLRVEVRGKVQGVSFRYFVVEKAQSLGINGYVTNLPDPRSLEVVAEGGRNVVEELLGHIRQGPRWARVDEVETCWSEALQAYPDFRVLHWHSVGVPLSGVGPAAGANSASKGVFSNYSASIDPSGMLPRRRATV